MPRSSAGGPPDRFVNITDRLIAPVILLSGTGVIEYVNTAAATLLNQERGWLVGRRFSALVHPADRTAFGRLLRGVAAGRPSGRSTVVRVRPHGAMDWRVLECIADNVLDEPEIAGILLAVHDLTESRAEARALEELAYRDSLTGLPNRARIVAELADRLTDPDRLTLGLVGIDRLGRTEDSLGRTGAEALIEAIGRRIRAAVPADAVVGRLEGGVFATILPGRVVRDASALAWRLVEGARAPLFVGTREVHPSVSVGLAQPDASATVESLLWDAGFALHRAEAHGGGRVERFSTELRHELIARLELEADLRRAVEHRCLSLAFQPIVRLDDRSVVGSEALLRWHRAGGDVPPADFVSVAEEAGLIVPLGEWVVAHAAEQAHRVPGGRVSINLSPRQLANPGLPRVLEALVFARAEREAVQFEITESLAIETWEQAVGIVGELRHLGFRVGLDDFGTGYSSLAYLRRLPIDFLKVDRSLIADIDTDRRARSIAGGAIKLAKALGLEVIAEGVERQSQAVPLLELGADLAQGHLFGVPTELQEPGAA